jgi:hypothetical protein
MTLHSQYHVGVRCVQWAYQIARITPHWVDSDSLFIFDVRIFLKTRVWSGNIHYCHLLLKPASGLVTFTTAICS